MVKSKLFGHLLVFSGIFLFGFLPFLASSAPLVPCGRGTGTFFVLCDLCSFIVLVNRIVQFLLFDLGLPIGVIAILVAGYFFLTAGGSEQQIQQGKDTLKYAVFGLIIAFGAWLIVDTILRGLTDPNGFLQTGPWNNFPDCP